MRIWVCLYKYYYFFSFQYFPYFNKTLYKYRYFNIFYWLLQFFTSLVSFIKKKNLFQKLIGPSNKFLAIVYYQEVRLVLQSEFVTNSALLVQEPISDIANENLIVYPPTKTLVLIMLKMIGMLRQSIWYLILIYLRWCLDFMNSIFARFLRITYTCSPFCWIGQWPNTND